jgi:preprotein translocase SecF subunit
MKFPKLRLVPENTSIQFMRGRVIGLVMSVVISALSVAGYFWPGLNYGIDFAGGILIEVRTPEPANFAALRDLMARQQVGQVWLQQFGSPSDVAIRLERPQGGDAVQQQTVEKVRAALEREVPGIQIRRVDAVGASVSADLLRSGMTALGLAVLAMLAYITFRFEWQFGVGAVVTLLLDVTKTVGFYVVTGFQFNLVAIAAILTIMGYSINDKIVVYDRVRENLRKHKSMSLRSLIDLSINETLSRTVGTSIATFLTVVPLALYGGEALREFAWTMLFGVVLATSSSIFIAAPILLFLGEDRLHRVPQSRPAVAAGRP